jgi:hypothetical protein
VDVIGDVAVAFGGLCVFMAVLAVIRQVFLGVKDRRT